MRFISVMTHAYNEEENVHEAYQRVKEVIEKLGRYKYEHVFIDNASTDATPAILREIAANDRNIKVILNTKNFGPYRSPLHALFQTKGEAVIPVAADLQDPPELIPQFLEKWEDGYKIVAAVKQKSLGDSLLLRLLRATYYQLIASLSRDSEQIKGFTGFGLYDRKVIELIASTGDHYPYVRGLIGDMGYPVARVEYIRAERRRGISKNNLYDLYTQAMNGITHHSKFPLRLAAFIGFFIAIASVLVAGIYCVYKFINWYNFTVGIAPLVIGLFFFGGVQLIFLGIIGEYIAAIYERIFQRWIVIEKERINFD